MMRQHNKHWLQKAQTCQSNTVQKQEQKQCTCMAKQCAQPAKLAAKRGHKRSAWPVVPDGRTSAVPPAYMLHTSLPELLGHKLRAASTIITACKACLR